MKRKEYQIIVDTKELVNNSIQVCREFQNRDENKTTIVAFSGGKDSLVVYMMAVESGIDFIPIYSPTSVDPPELIYFIKEFSEWAKSKSYPEIVFQKYNTWKTGVNKGKIKTMWNLLANRAIPPTRLARYCCDELKERTGSVGDTVFTGVRWEESKSRSKQKQVNFYKGKIMVRPIVAWKEVDIWSYILSNDIPYCNLYDKGFNRLGCIGCPLSSNQRKELELYPRYKAQYIRSFDKMIEYRKSHGYDQSTSWKNGKDIYDWWIGAGTNKSNQIEGQCSMF